MKQTCIFVFKKSNYFEKNVAVLFSGFSKT